MPDVLQLRDVPTPAIKNNEALVRVPAAAVHPGDLFLMETTHRADLTDLIDAGKLTPVIDRTYPLVETPQALRYVGDGHAHGKGIITV